MGENPPPYRSQDSFFPSLQGPARFRNRWKKNAPRVGFHSTVSMVPIEGEQILAVRHSSGRSATMRFAYWTIDEVNQDLAERLAAETGVHLDVLSFRDIFPAGLFDAVLYDLDFFPPDRRQVLLADLQAGRRTEPVAVHSYHLLARHALALRRQGVIVTRRLRPQVFNRLWAAVAARQANQQKSERAAGEDKSPSRRGEPRLGANWEG
jgi:hypothetical protein